MRREAAEPDAIPAIAKMIAADGSFLGPHTKYRFSDSRGLCGWHRLSTDTALQARVWRVGMRVVPEYQKKLAADDAARIRFRFYAVDDPKTRSEFACTLGLILIPELVVKRFTTDDQLAAVLADGIAADLQWQQFWHGPEKYVWLGENAAELAANFATPSGFLGVEGGELLVNRELMKHLEEQRGRMALGMLADAGYDALRRT